MNLREFRKHFIETSGRYDLWNEDGTDNGIDHFIRLGQRYLETVVHWDSMESLVNFELYGVSNFMLPYARTIKRVAVQFDENQRFVELVRVSLPMARSYFLRRHLFDCYPMFYTVYRQRGQWETVRDDNFFDATARFQDVTNKENYNSVGILLSPVLQPDQRVQVEVEGLFRQKELLEDDDENYWTTQWPNVLTFATYRELEIIYRNTQGVKDWEQAIASTLVQHEMDFILDESGPIDVMIG